MDLNSTSPAQGLLLLSVYILIIHTFPEVKCVTLCDIVARNCSAHMYINAETGFYLIKHRTPKAKTLPFCIFPRHSSALCYANILSLWIHRGIALYFWWGLLLGALLVSHCSEIYWGQRCGHQSMMRTVYHDYRASHLLFRCRPVLHRDRAIGLLLSQRMTPERHIFLINEAQ